MRSYFTLFFLAIIFTFNLAAQPVSKPKYDELLEFAQQLFDQKDYYNALEKFEEAYDEKKDRALTLPIAQLHYLLRDYAKAERWYDRLLKRDKEDKYAEERYMYGRILKMNGVYQEAITELQRFIEETESDSLRSLAQMEIAGSPTCNGNAGKYQCRRNCKRRSRRQLQLLRIFAGIGPRRPGALLCRL